MVKRKGLFDKMNAGTRIRTLEGTKPLPPQGSPLDRSGPPANACKSKKQHIFKIMQKIYILKNLNS